MGGPSPVFRLFLHPPKFNSEFTPEKWWLVGRRDDPPFLLGETVTFQGRNVKLREGICSCPF